MFDFKRGIWMPDREVVVERTMVPDPAPRPDFVQSTGSPGIAIIQSSRFGVRLAGFGDEDLSVTPLYPGDHVVLMFDKPFWIPLERIRLAGDSSARTVAFRVQIRDPLRLLNRLSDDLERLDERGLGQLISGDRSIGAAIQTALDRNGIADVEKFRAALSEALDSGFGLAVKSGPDHVQVGSAQTSASDLEPGDLLDGQWELLEPIAAGAFGQVWRASQRRQPGLIRAIKIVHDEAMARTIVREENRLVQLENADIDYTYLARLMGVSSSEPPFLIYEFVQGPTLRAYVEQSGGQLPLKEALEITRQLLRAIDEIHHGGLVHRDLHPGNTIVNRRRGALHVKVLDLGLAAPLSGGMTPQDEGKSVLAMTPSHPFAEPPDERDWRDPDERTDIYSAGILLWWMLTGRPRLPVGRSLQDIWPEGPMSVLQLVSQASIVSRASRFVNARDMLEALDRAEAEPGVSGMWTGSPADSGTEAPEKGNPESHAALPSDTVRAARPIQRKSEASSSPTVLHRKVEGPERGRVIWVGTTADADLDSFDAALALPGVEEIHLAAGIHQLAGAPVIETSLLITGAGTGETIVEGGRGPHLLRGSATSNLTIRDLTLRRTEYPKSPPNTSILHFAGCFRVSNCQLHGSRRDYSAGVTISDSASGVLEDCRIEDNDIGVVVMGAADVRISHNTLHRNFSGGISCFDSSRGELDDNNVMFSRIGIMLERTVDFALRDNVVSASSERDIVDLRKLITRVQAHLWTPFVFYIFLAILVVVITIDMYF